MSYRAHARYLKQTFFMRFLVAMLRRNDKRQDLDKLESALTLFTVFFVYAKLNIFHKPGHIFTNL